MLEKSLSLPLVRCIVVSVGMFVILFGMADMVSRVGSLTFGHLSGAQIFSSPAAQDFSASGDSTFARRDGGFVSALPLASTTPIIPTRLTIPSIGVDAVVEQVGNTSAGAMATPKSFGNVGWYSPGNKPGEVGSVVMAGHVNNALTKAGVFEHLSQVKIGDIVTVSDKDNKTLVYTVNEIDEYPVEGAPTASIFTSTGPTQLVLITCDGSWDGNAHSFDKRLVVYARLSV